MRSLSKKSGSNCSFIGCLHLLPLPGSAGWKGSMAGIVDCCLKEAEIYAANGADGLIVENTHDTPYLRKKVDAGTIAGCAVAAAAVRERFGLPVGIQILAAANVPALEVAATCDLDFVRVEGFAFAHVADEGIIEGDAGKLLRRRAHLGCTGIEIWADAKKKHSSHAITSDLSIEEIARGYLFFEADGVIVTGGHTGEAPLMEDVRAVARSGAKTIIGSGVTTDNVLELAEAADVLIVGSACKTDGSWKSPVDGSHVRSLTDAMSQ